MTLFRFIITVTLLSDFFEAENHSRVKVYLYRLILGILSSILIV